MLISDTIGIYLPYNLAGSVKEAGLGEAHVDWDARDDSPKVACTAAFAASEIATYLLRLLPSLTVEFVSDPDAAQIFLGDATALRDQATPNFAAPSPDPQAYAVSMVPFRHKERLVIAGSDRAGILYGAYGFLHELGVRWYGPETWQETLPPPATEIRLPPGFQLASSPSFCNLRGFHVEPAEKSRPSLFLWMARNRLNLWEQNHGFTPLLRKLCFQLNGGGHTWEHWLHPDMPVEPFGTLFDAHPEWFAEVGGKRERRLAARAQFCVSNSAARAFFLDNMVRSLQEEYRGVDILGFWPYDTWCGWCECPGCSAIGNHTDQYLFIASCAQERIRQAYATGQISRMAALNLCAYEGAGTLDPPSRGLPDTLRLSEAYVSFFPINRCYAHGIDDTQCQEMNETYRRTFSAWANTPFAQAGRLVVGEYYNVSKYEDLPLLFYDIMPRDLRYYHGLGARSIHYMHVSLGNWGPRALTNCLFAALSWDVDAKGPQLVDDFLQGYFQDVAPVMAEVFRLVREGYSNVAAWRAWHRSVNSRLLAHYRQPKETPAFALRHLQYNSAEIGVDSGISAVAGHALLAEACRLIEGIDRSALPRNVSRRVAECGSLIRYGEASYRLYLHLALLFEADRVDNALSARKHLQAALKAAAALEEMTIAWPFEWPTVTEMNGLAKTQMTPVLDFYRDKFNSNCT